MNIRAGIIGGAGYTAGELIRILLQHPHVKIAFVHSVSNAGNLVTDLHDGLIGDTDLRFSSSFNICGLDVLFLCSAHGDSRQFLEASHLPPFIKIIDLSMDYRHQASAEDFIYGLPERNRDAIRTANRIANPGCFATAIQLALLPLAHHKFIHNEVHVHAITGSTGAGVKPSPTTHFSWRNNNLSIYKPFEHQHLTEICESLHCPPAQINLIPVRGDFPRGIFVSAYTDTPLPFNEVQFLYANYYRTAPFTHLTDRNIDLKQALNTNKCIIHLEKHGSKLLILSVIDNLLKGASGQAVQNMNLMFGLDESEGLRFKPSGF
jgi:N-acetyl-gamma-glutamyl-phosphate reductase